MTRQDAPEPKKNFLSRRAFVAATLAGIVPVAAAAQATPGASPVASPASSPAATPAGSPAASPAASPVARRSTDSWFVTSAQESDGGFTVASDRFEVYSGSTRQRLGGFRAPGTTDMCLTSDPGKVLLNTANGIGVFDLPSGRFTVLSGTEGTNPTNVWLPDPRLFEATPPGWTFVRTYDASQAWLVDLTNLSATDLVPLLASGGVKSYSSIAFSPDGKQAAAYVDDRGAWLFDPADPSGARHLDGGESGSIAGLPVFSDSGDYLAYPLLTNDTSSEGKIIVEEIASQKVIASVGGVSAMASCLFLPDSDVDLLIMDDGTMTRQAIDTGAEAWSTTTRTLAYGWGYTNDLKHILYGSVDRVGSPIYWVVVDLASGEATKLDGLEALTFYNGSYPDGGTYTLFGPPYLSSSQDNKDALVAFNSTNDAVTPLLDDSSAWALARGYATSQDGRIALYADQSTVLLNLETGTVKNYANLSTGQSAHGVYVSPDGATAAITNWDTSGAGTQDLYLIDVAAGGEPVRFLEKTVLWLWAGVPADATAATARVPGFAGDRGKGRALALQTRGVHRIG